MLRENAADLESLLAALEKEAPSSDSRSAAERIKFVADRPGHDRRYAVDARKAHRDLGWEPRESFKTGISKTVRWYLDRQDWVQSINEGTYRGERLGLG